MDSETSQKGPSSVRMYRSCLVTAGVAGVFNALLAPLAAPIMAWALRPELSLRPTAATR